MTTRRKWSVAILTAAIAVGIYVSTPSEPSYAGYTLTEWLLFQCTPREPVPAPGTAEAVRRMGPEAIPCLIRWIEDSAVDATRRERALLWLYHRLPAATKPKDPEIWTHHTLRDFRSTATLAAFDILGTNASPAIPKLEQMASSPKQDIATFLAFSALHYIGPEAVPALGRIARNTNAAFHLEALKGKNPLDDMPPLPANQPPKPR
jgi:hypothetical protein